MTGKEEGEDVEVLRHAGRGDGKGEGGWKIRGRRTDEGGNRRG